MNELQNAVKKSFRTHSHRVEEFTDPDGVHHPAHLLEEPPYCANMEALAIKFDLSISQTYRLLKEPHRKWSKLALEELHKQLHWIDRYPWDDSIRVPIAETRALIRRSASYERRRSIDANEARQKHDPANPDNQITFKMTEGMKKFLDEQRQMTEKFEGFFKQQEEFVKRLLDLNERQQGLIEKLTGQIAESSTMKALESKNSEYLERLKRALDHLQSGQGDDETDYPEEEVA